MHVIMYMHVHVLYSLVPGSVSPSERLRMRLDMYMYM